MTQKVYVHTYNRNILIIGKTERLPVINTKVYYETRARSLELMCITEVLAAPSDTRAI